MGLLSRFFRRSSSVSSESRTVRLATRCDHCGGLLHPDGRPAYWCTSCRKNFCNPCALRKGASHSSATVACPNCAPVIAGVLRKCGGCGSGVSESLELVHDKKQNRGYLCRSCKSRYASLLQPDSIRNFWMCDRCKFRVLANTDVDARIDEAAGNRCPHCGNRPDTHARESPERPSHREEHNRGARRVAKPAHAPATGCQSARIASRLS